MGKPTTTKPPSIKGGPYTNTKPETQVQAKKSHDDFTSDGVEDNDVFLLPVSDYQVMLLVTVIGAVVRLFRIYQPTSVVFDEVQYAQCTLLTAHNSWKTNLLSSFLALEASPPSTSTANSSWMSILP